MYKCYNSLNGHECFTNFRPNKKELFQIAIKEDWGSSEEDIQEKIDSGDYSVTKVSVYGK